MVVGMAKEKAIGSRSWPLVPPGLFQLGVYKRNQGRTVRLVTSVILGAIVALSAWRLHETLAASRFSAYEWIVSAVLLFGGWWLCYRLIQLPKFADFLIAVEAEMSKVSWPTRTELIRSSLVVMFFIVSLAAMLFMFDVFWQTVFRFLGIID